VGSASGSIRGSPHNRNAVGGRLRGNYKGDTFSLVPYASGHGSLLLVT
jgi:hypothetical protein